MKFSVELGVAVAGAQGDSGLWFTVFADCELEEVVADLPECELEELLHEQAQLRLQRNYKGQEIVHTWVFSYSYEEE